MELEGKGSSSEEESSSDEDRQFAKEEKKELGRKKREGESNLQIQPKFYEIKPGEDFKASDLAGSGRSKMSKYVTNPQSLHASYVIRRILWVA